MSPRDRLAALRSLRVASQAANKKAIVQSEAKAPKPSLKTERKRKLAEELLALQKAEAAGLDPERLQNTSYTIDDVERWDAVLDAKKEREDRGFTDFAQIASKKYKKMIGEFTPDLNKYETGKGEEDYRGAHSVKYADPDHKPDRRAVERLVKDVEKQYDRCPLGTMHNYLQETKDVEKQNLKRGQFSRRRAFNEDEDVTYINERNMRFNKKISRAYDEYTKEIKQNFERGTAL